MKAIKFDNEADKIKDFLSLPKKLYGKDNNTENASDVEKMLKGEHPLSKYFTLTKWVIYDEANKPAARFAITEYPNEKSAYLGYYECIDNDEAAKCVFDTAYEFAAEKGYEKIEGPIDTSFWVKYRLKINKFDCKPYTGEPYNLEYYFKQFKDNGFEVEEHYTSQEFGVSDGIIEQFDERLKKFSEAGYEIVSPAVEDFDKVVGELYDLISVLYSDFPIYKEVSKEDFATVFKDYKTIANMQMVKMAYYNKQAVGFYVSIPNYGNLVYHTGNPFNLIKIMKIKKNPKDYVMLYMGVDQNHRGLGKALVGSIVRELTELKVPSIGALTKDGKLTQNYAEDKIESRYEYVLLGKNINKQES